MLIVDILENMNKYSTGNNQLLLEITDSNISILFINDVQGTRKDMETLKQDIKNFNNNKRSEINKRSSFGLMHIIDFCDTLNIQPKLTLAEHDQRKIFTVTLNLQGEYINV